MIDRIKHKNKMFYALSEKCVTEPDLTGVMGLESSLISLETTLLDINEKAKDLMGRGIKSSKESTSYLPKLDIPKFKGEMGEYKLWKQKFSTITAEAPENQRKLHLIGALEGDAHDWVQTLITNNKDIAEIWATLDKHFGNEKNIIDSTVQKFLSVPSCEENLKSLRQRYIEGKNAATGVANLGLDIDQLLATMHMMKIPGQYRSELERSLANAKKVKYTFADLDDHMEEMFRIHGHRMADGSESKSAAIAAKVGGVSREVEPDKSNLQKATSQSPAKPNRGKGKGRGKGARGRGGQRPGNMSTIICDLCNTNGHYAHTCRNIKNGNDVRQKLRDLGKCDACMVHKDKHPEECPQLGQLCYNCYTPGHFSPTCDGEHPGSWLKKTK